MLDLVGRELSRAEAEQLRHRAVGGVILFTRNYANPVQLQALVAQIRAIRPEVLVAADTEGGRVQRFRSGFLRLPAVGRYGQAYAERPQQALRAAAAGGWLLAAELRAVDVDLAFAPVLDLDGGVSQIIGDRAFSAEPEAVSALARAHRRGMREAGMAATGKHFPGHGYVAPDSHLELPVDERVKACVLERDCQPYRALLTDGLESIMAAHIRFPQVDQRPASISAIWLQDILRGQLGFDGAIFADDLSMGGLAQYGDVLERARAALEAGCDMLPVCNRPEEVRQLLELGGLEPQQISQRRLRRLRGERRAVGLDALRKSPEYISKINELNNLIQVKVED